MMILMTAALAAAAPLAQQMPSNDMHAQHIAKGHDASHAKMECCDCCKDMAEKHEGHFEHDGHTGR